MSTQASNPTPDQQPQTDASAANRSEGTSQSMLDRETYGQILDQPAPDADTSDLTSGPNQPASQHFGNEERVPGQENPNTRAD